jgi:hypothetical protein
MQLWSSVSKTHQCIVSPSFHPKPSSTCTEISSKSRKFRGSRGVFNGFELRGAKLSVRIISDGMFFSCLASAADPVLRSTYLIYYPKIAFHISRASSGDILARIRKLAGIAHMATTMQCIVRFLLWSFLNTVTILISLSGFALRMLRLR